VTHCAGRIGVVRWGLPVLFVKVTLPGSQIAINAAGPPTQPPVLLSHIGASVRLNPLRLTGTIGLSAANLVAEDWALFGVFASAHNRDTLPEDAGPELAPLASRTFDRFSLAIGTSAGSYTPPAARSTCRVE
jgi:hypothetical protein